MARLISSDPAARRRIGVLLVNLGTPDAPQAAPVRRYLKEFLSDPRVVEIPALFWQPLLRGVILNTRPAKSAAKYVTIWSKEGSPLLHWSQTQAKLVKGWLGERLGPQTVRVELAMRYGQPALSNVLSGMSDCDRILVVPLYPQYASSTTASVCDAVFAELARLRDQPAIRTVRSFATDPSYIRALAERVQTHWQQDGRGDHLLMSFHGIPQRSIELGDAYQNECLASGRALARQLGLADSAWSLSFQSRFGPAKWLQPYTRDTLAELGSRGIGTLDVICPGFVADCLETLEEIADEGRETFLHAGGKRYRYIAALNDSPHFITALGGLIERELGGWLTN
ncbi:ferrochelatase [Chitinibacteraceae bacterium HSL-7]